MKISFKSKPKLNEILFYLACYPWVISWILTSTYFKDILHPYGIIRIWNIVGAVLIALRVLLIKRINQRRTIIAIMVILTGAIVSYNNDNASFVFYSLALIFAAYNINVNKIITHIMYFQIIITAITILSSLFNIIPNNVGVSSAGGGILRTRYSLGYTYATYAPNYLLSIVIEYFYLKIENRRKWTFWQISLIIVINCFLYRFTRTRVSFFMVFLIIVLGLVYQFLLKNKENKILRFLCKYSYIICFLITLAGVVLYSPSNSILYKINSLLSERLRFAQLGISTWGISLFGSSVTWDTVASSYNYVDSSFINILICYGIIVLGVVLFGFTIAAGRAAAKNDLGLCIALSLWAFRAMIDPQLFLIWFNPFMFYIGESVLKQDFIPRRKKVVINSMRL